jgi:hypothetical protein
MMTLEVSRQLWCGKEEERARCKNWFLFQGPKVVLNKKKDALYKPSDRKLGDLGYTELRENLPNGLNLVCLHAVLWV